MLKRRDLLQWIGASAGTAAMYQAMASIGLAGASSYRGRLRLEGESRNASVLILGAGLAGLVAGLELRKAGYKVQILEYRDRAGGRTWTIRGGDSYAELGGAVQRCEFEPELYFNPGPWRIPYHHYAVLDYCRQLGVALEPFVQTSPNAYLHSQHAFGGKPQRYRHVQSDYYGYAAELLAKAVNQHRLDENLDAGDVELLLESLRDWGALDGGFRYRKGDLSGARRGWEQEPGGGLAPGAVPSPLIERTELLQSRLWRGLSLGLLYDFQPVMFQPIGGMDMIARAVAAPLADAIHFNTRVTAIEQRDKEVVVTFEDTKAGGRVQQRKADWCVCTLPLSILSQLKLDAGAPMQEAIRAVSYAAAVKIGLQFKRRFWEEDEHIFGGASLTDQDIAQIAYPSSGYGTRGKGVLLGGYAYGTAAFDLTARPPSERVSRAVRMGAQIHRQYATEFENGVAVAWHRVPWTLGCFALWDEETRRRHYSNLCAIDGRIVLAGEHLSHLPGWQEGAVLSALDTVSRLHQRVLA